jgi:hypothetical protein
VIPEEREKVDWTILFEDSEATDTRPKMKGRHWKPKRINMFEKVSLRGGK